MRVVCIINRIKSDFLVFVCMILSFFSFVIFDVSGKISENESADIDAMNYAYVVKMYVAGNVDYDGLFRKLKDLINDVDIIIDDINLYIGDSESFRLADIIVVGDNLKYPFVDGDYSGNKTIHDRSVVIGKRLYKYTHGDNDRYILVNGEEYIVSGIVSAEHSAIIDYYVLLDYESIGKRVKKDLDMFIKTQGISVVLLSDVVDERRICQAIESLSKEYPENVFVDDKSSDTRFYASEKKSSFYMNGLLLIFAFSEMLIILSVDYWYKQNIRNMCLRRMFGYSKCGLIMYICRKYVSILFGALFLSELSVYIVSKLIGESDVNMVRSIGVHVAALIKYILVVIFLLVAFICYRVLSKEPIELYTEK